jgi:PRTRC genetic system protein C
MMEQNMQQARNPARRVFVYDGHRFDDPGAEYSVEQVQNHLVLYFPAVAHAAVEEKMLPDGTREITFRKQVARKGSEIGEPGRLAILLAELDTIPPYDDPLAELTVMPGSGPLSLAAILDARDTLQAHADRIFGLADRTTRAVERCVSLPPCPLRGVPSGF